MTNAKHVQRAASAVHGNNAARKIVQKRDKQYRTERQLVPTVRKKLHANAHLIADKLDPPPGYTFVPFGTPDLVRRCKEIALERNVTSYHVAASRKKHALDLAHLAHQVGYYLDLRIVSEACKELGYTTHDGRLIKSKELDETVHKLQLASTLEKYGIAPEDAHSLVKSTESKQDVFDSFHEIYPNMPVGTIREIIDHAWQPDTQRIGLQYDLPLQSRVQAATVAHIRHKYTDYDRLLSAFGDRNQARRTVEQHISQKVIEWGYIVDNTQNPGIETYQDIIILDDESESDDDDRDSSAFAPGLRNQPSSPIIVSDDEEPRGSQIDARPNRGALEDLGSSAAEASTRVLGERYIKPPVPALEDSTQVALDSRRAHHTDWRQHGSEAWCGSDPGIDIANPIFRNQVSDPYSHAMPWSHIEAGRHQAVASAPSELRPINSCMRVDRRRPTGFPQFVDGEGQSLAGFYTNDRLTDDVVVGHAYEAGLVSDGPTTVVRDRSFTVIPQQNHCRNESLEPTSLPMFVHGAPAPVQLMPLSAGHSRRPRAPFRVSRPSASSFDDHGHRIPSWQPYPVVPERYC